VAIYEANEQINTNSLYRIRTGLHDVEDLVGYLESNNAKCARMSIYIQCLLYKVKKSCHLGITASNTCSDIFCRTGVVCFLSDSV
jgi:hypothetical protein